MLSPVLTLIIAGSIQVGVQSDRPVDLAQIVLEITEAILPAGLQAPHAADGPTVRDIPYYYSDFTPLAAPAVEPLVTYDWRSPVIFDLP